MRNPITCALGLRRPFNTFNNSAYIGPSTTSSTLCVYLCVFMWRSRCGLAGGNGDGRGLGQSAEWVHSLLRRADGQVDQREGARTDGSRQQVHWRSEFCVTTWMVFADVAAGTAPEKLLKFCESALRFRREQQEALGYHVPRSLSLLLFSRLSLLHTFLPSPLSSHTHTHFLSLHHHTGIRITRGVYEMP